MAMIRPILIHPDPRLKKVCEPVSSVTTDLGALRSDVDASLRKVDALINDLNRKWPFARDTEIKLP